MPDNAPAPDGKPNPTSPLTSGAGPGRTSLPPSTLKFKKRHTGKVVVLLSSVAKAPPPRTTQALAGTPAPEPTVAKATVAIPLPANKVAPSASPGPTPSKPSAVSPAMGVTPPPVPSGQTALIKADLKGPGPKRAAPIKLNLPTTTPAAPANDSIFDIEDEAPSKGNSSKAVPVKSKNDSIFEVDDTPPVTEESIPSGWKALEPGELLDLTGGLESLDVFSNAQPKVESEPSQEVAPQALTAKTPAPDVKPLAEAKAPAAPPPLSPAKPAAKTPAPDFKPLEEAKAPVTPLPLAPAKPLVELPPITSSAPVTTLQPATVLSSPAPVAKREGARPPPLPQPKALGITAPLVNPVQALDEKEAAGILHLAPPLSAKAGVTPEAKLHQPHFPVTADKEETAPTVTEKLPSLAEPSTLRHAPALIKTEPSQGRKLPPPLPPREPAKISPAVTGPIVTKESTPAVLPEKTPSTAPGPIVLKASKPALVPEKGRRPVTLPARKVKLANLPPPVSPAADEASSLLVSDPAGTKENKPVPEAKPTASVPPLQKAEPIEAKAPPLETKPTTPLPAVTGPTVGKESKPALRPPALPSKLIREQELKKVSEIAEPTAAPLETGVVAKSSPTDLPPKISESQKHTPAVVQPDKPAVAVPPAAPSTPATAPVSDKSATPKKHRLPVKINRPKPAEPPSVAAPVAVAAGVAMAAAAAVGLDQTKVVNVVPPVAAPVETKPVKSTPPAKPPLASTRAARLKRKRLIGTIAFYILCLLFPFALLHIGTYFSHETRVEGQVIPPSGMVLGDEAWIVGDFHDMISTVTEDLAADRTPKLQDIQERLNHVQRAQADIQAREERIRLLQGQIEALKDEINVTVKQVRDAAQAVWDGPGADIDQEYDDRQAQLGRLIADRAKSLNLDYEPDPNFNSPEVWANAYRLALYQVPKNVDSAKEHLWLEDQMKQWRSFTKSLDDQKEQLRDKAAALRQGPAAKVADLQARIDDIQHRIDGTVSEEAPIKAELQQAQDDLNESQADEASLDDKYYKELYALPESSITKRLPIEPNGRFSWRHVEKDSAFAEGEHVHNFWLFVRAARPDGRQYWALFPISVGKDSTLEINIEPSAFLSTKAMLRPDLSPDEQEQ